MQSLGTQFDRDYLLTFKNLESGTILQVTSLRCTFDIEMYVDNKSQTNKGTVNIYNLKKETLDKIDTRFGKLVFDVGYKGDVATLMEGDVINIKTTRSGADIITSFEMAPNFLNLAIKPVALNLPEGCKLEDAVKAVAGELGFSLPNNNIKYDWKDIIITYGYPAYGTGKQVLDDLASAYNIEWKIIDNVLYITDRYSLIDGDKESAIVLNRNTGLIGIPYTDTEEVHKSLSQALDTENEQYIYTPPSLKKDGTPRKTSKYKVRRYGVKVVALLNPRIRPNSLIKVETEDFDIKGFYRVRSAKFSGDTRGNEWQMELQGDGVKATEFES